MTDDDMDQMPEILDDLFLTFEPFEKKPGQTSQDDINELMEFLGFLPGTLHCCTYAFPWLWGRFEEPAYLGQTGLDLTQCVLTTKPNEPFLFVECILLEATYARKKSDWMYAIKAMIRDKIVYFPVPIATMDENSKYLFKEIFRAAQTEET